MQPVGSTSIVARGVVTDADSLHTPIAGHEHTFLAGPMTPAQCLKVHLFHFWGTCFRSAVVHDLPPSAVTSTRITPFPPPAHA